MKGTNYSLQLIVHRWAVLFPHLSIPDLGGILCHTSAAEPSATSVSQSQVLLGGPENVEMSSQSQCLLSGFRGCKTLLRFPKPR